MARKKKSSKDTEGVPEDTQAGDADARAETDNAAEIPDPALTERAEDAAEAGSETPNTDAHVSPDAPNEGETTQKEDAEQPEDTEEPKDLTPDPEEKSEEKQGEDEGDPGDAEVVESQPIVETPAMVTTEQVVIRKGGFVPMLLGGLAAGIIGFGIAQYGLPKNEQSDEALADVLLQLESQGKAISDLSAQVANAPDGPDLSGILGAQADQQSLISGMSERLADIESQISDLQNRPSGDDAPDIDLSAYDNAIKSLREIVEEQSAAIDAMQQNAAMFEENAKSAAQATLQRAALTRIQTALDAGTGFAPALADLEATGVDVPDALREVADEGVPSLPELLDQLPDAARAALYVSRDDAGASGDSGGFASFLRSQLGARSLEPRDGSDPDAVLSRVEAAAREGRLTDALAEIETLPETGRAELSYWSGQVARRMEAVSAVRELSEKLN